VSSIMPALLRPYGMPCDHQATLSWRLCIRRLIESTVLPATTAVRDACSAAFTMHNHHHWRRRPATQRFWLWQASCPLLDTRNSTTCIDIFQCRSGQSLSLLWHSARRSCHSRQRCRYCAVHDTHRPLRHGRIQNPQDIEFFQCTLLLPRISWNQ